MKLLAQREIPVGFSDKTLEGRISNPEGGPLWLWPWTNHLQNCEEEEVCGLWPVGYFMTVILKKTLLYKSWECTRKGDLLNCKRNPKFKEWQIFIYGLITNLQFWVIERLSPPRSINHPSSQFLPDLQFFLSFFSPNFSFWNPKHTCAFPSTHYLSIDQKLELCDSQLRTL